MSYYQCISGKVEMLRVQKFKECKPHCFELQLEITLFFSNTMNQAKMCIIFDAYE